MYKEWQRQDGNVREMSNACRPCPVYFTGWNVHSGEEGADQGGGGSGGGARSHLLMTKQHRCLDYALKVIQLPIDPLNRNLITFVTTSFYK